MICFRPLHLNFRAGRWFFLTIASWCFFYYTYFNIKNLVCKSNTDGCAKNLLSIMLWQKEALKKIPWKISGNQFWVLFNLHVEREGGKHNTIFYYSHNRHHFVSFCQRLYSLGDVQVIQSFSRYGPEIFFN